MVTLSKLVTRLKIEGNRAELDGSMMVGKGPLVLGGWLSWAQQPVTGSLTIQGKELEAQYPGMGRVRVTPDIAISLGEETRVTGQVDIPWSRILVKSLPDSAVAVSDDVTVIYDDLPPVPKAAPLPMEIRLAIRLGDDVRLEAMGLKTKVEGPSTFARIPPSRSRATGNWSSGTGASRPMARTSSSRRGGSSSPAPSISPISTSRPIGIRIPSRTT